MLGRKVNMWVCKLCGYVGKRLGVAQPIAKKCTGHWQSRTYNPKFAQGNLLYWKQNILLVVLMNRSVVHYYVICGSVGRYVGK